LDEAIDVMRSYGIEPPAHVIDSMSTRSASPVQDQLVQVVGDGRTAAFGAVAAVSEDIATARVRDDWLEGPTDAAVEEFVRGAGAGITVAVGETTLQVRGEGTGGRNTHAALLAARLIAGTSTKFAALATDGVDGNSKAAGAIVDGLSLARGGDSDAALAHFDSATYLKRSGDLLDTGPTGTNVADLWLVWAPE
jgi:glycerate-2-kinase